MCHHRYTNDGLEFRFFYGIVWLNTMNILICEDDQTSLNQLKQLFGHIKLNGPLSVQFFSVSFDVMDFLQGGQVADVYLLDVVMPGLNGIQLAKAIRKHDPFGVIVFLTSSKEFAIHAFEVEAYAYLLKPYDAVKIKTLLEKIEKQKLIDAQAYLIYRHKDQFERIMKRDLVYVEVNLRTIRLKLKDGRTLSHSGRLHSYLEQLTLNDGFIQCHKSFLVNLAEVVQFQKTYLITRQNEHIPISRRLYPATKLAFLSLHSAGDSLNG